MQGQPTIDDRLLLILKEQGGRSASTSAYDKTRGANFVVKGYWQGLERDTGIKASKWRSFATGNQRPTPDMIEAAARHWPHYAFWLATGITDVANGHAAPRTATQFPEFANVEDSTAYYYFRDSLLLLKRLLDRTKTTAALERVNVLGKYRGGKAIEIAYKLSETEEYQRLRELWSQRENERIDQIGRLTGTHRPWLKKKKSNNPPPDDAIADTRTAHQDLWDLFYKSRAPEEGQER